MKNMTMNYLILTLSATLVSVAPVMAKAKSTALTRVPTATTTATTASTTSAVVGDADDTLATPISAEIQKRLRTLLNSNLPKFDKQLLTAYETTTAWEDNLEFSSLNRLLGEKPFEWEGKEKPPVNATRFEDANKSIRINREKGAFRYQSRTRAFSPEWKGKQAPSADIVGRQLEGLLRNLKFPFIEKAESDVKVQVTSVSDESGREAERFPVYAFYVMKRSVESIPVEGSTVRAAVNLKGEIQRLKVAWPHFSLRKGVKILSREEVVDLALSEVLKKDPTDSIQMASRVIYTPTEKGDYLPAVQVDVTDGETPYRFTVAVAR